jgi:hypothetical protein
MKKISLILAVALTMLVLFVLVGLSYACTVGVKDCRPASTGSTTCYWWVCKTCGSETCWIFDGTTCACPSSKNELDTSRQVCENQLEDESNNQDLG